MKDNEDELNKSNQDIFYELSYLYQELDTLIDSIGSDTIEKYMGNEACEKIFPILWGVYFEAEKLDLYIQNKIELDEEDKVLAFKLITKSNNLIIELKSIDYQDKLKKEDIDKLKIIFEKNKELKLQVEEFKNNKEKDKKLKAKVEELKLKLAIRKKKLKERFPNLYKGN